MMKTIARLAFVLLGIGLLIYLALPAPAFPDTLWDFTSSVEPADRESPLRRGYYTNLTREQLTSHYLREFGWGEKLNYPPENAQLLIRDQTKATFLEEVVHPMRESIFVAGNVLTPEKGNFEIGGKTFKTKVIVKYVQSNVFARIIAGILSMAAIWVLVPEWIKTITTSKWRIRL